MKFRAVKLENLEDEDNLEVCNDIRAVDFSIHSSADFCLIVDSTGGTWCNCVCEERQLQYNGRAADQVIQQDEVPI